uniref:Putative secreted protein n=1 Tax=Rhipicephalus microplus TaxID=6941 RepID=A0A6G5A5G0_RHIMP
MYLKMKTLSLFAFSLVFICRVPQFGSTAATRTSEDGKCVGDCYLTENHTIQGCPGGPLCTCTYIDYTLSYPKKENAHICQNTIVQSEGARNYLGT